MNQIESIEKNAPKEASVVNDSELPNEQGKESALKNQKSSINGFLNKFVHVIVELIYRAIYIILLIFLILIIDICNFYINDLFFRLFIKLVCIVTVILLGVKIIPTIYFYTLKTDRHKLAFTSGLIFILDILCLLSLVGVLNGDILYDDKLIICLTLPLLIMNISIIINNKSIVPVVIILLAFVGGIVLFTLSFFIDLASWRSSLVIASIVYMIFGLFCIIQLILYSFLNKNKSSKADGVDGEVVGKLSDLPKESELSNIKDKV